MSNSRYKFLNEADEAMSDVSNISSSISMKPIVNQKHIGIKGKFKTKNAICIQWISANVGTPQCNILGTGILRIWLNGVNHEEKLRNVAR